MKLVLVPAAVDDLSEIRAHIAKDNAAAVSTVGISLAEAMTLIASRPQIGRLTDHDDVREWSIPGLPFVIPYRTRGDTVEILRVWHTRRERPPGW